MNHTPIYTIVVENRRDHSTFTIRIESVPHAMAVFGRGPFRVLGVTKDKPTREALEGKVAA